MKATGTLIDVCGSFAGASGFTEAMRKRETKLRVKL
jgi:hypothetical protein